MPDPILKEISTPLAKELAEFALLQNDLKASHDAFALWFTKYAGRHHQLTAEEVLISQSLFRDSLVMLTGCFDKTAPLSLSASDVYGSTKGGLAYFKWLQDIRDSYAAHKFGPFRQCVTGVMVTDAGVILGAGRTIRIYGGFVVEAKDDVLSFIRIAERYVQKRVGDLSRQLADSARAMSAAELAALKPAQTYEVLPHEIRSTREKFRRSPRPGNDG
jgi:hypothetical protein